MVYRPLKKLRRVLLRTTGAALAAGVCLGGSLSLAEATSTSYKKFIFDVQGANNPVLKVTSSDNKKWDTLKNNSGVFWAKLRADVKYPAYVSAIGVFLGQCNLKGCAIASFPGGAAIMPSPDNALLYMEDLLKTRDYNTSKNISFGYKQLGNVKMTNGVGKSYKDHILERCNEGLTAYGPSEKVSFMQEIATTFVAATGKAFVPMHELFQGDVITLDKATKSKTSSFWLKVECEPVEALKPKTASVVLPPMQVDYLKVFLSTFSHTFSQPKAGVQCKKGRALMRIKTNRIGPVKLKLTTRLGNNPLRKDFFDVNAKLNQNGVPEAEVEKWFSTTETTVLKAMLSTVEPSGTSTKWEELPLNCSSSGGGGWAQPGDDDPSTPVANTTGLEGAATPTSKPVTGDLSLMDVGSNNGKGPARNGTAFIMMTYGKPTSLKYSLKCSGKRKWYGTIKPKKLETGLYGYSRTHNFKIDKTEKIKCVLRRTAGNGSSVLDTAERLYTVVKKSKGSSAGASAVTSPAGPNVGDQPAKLPLKLKSTVSLKDNTANAPKKLARYGLVAIAATSNKADDMTYKLKCGPGRQWSGKMVPKKKAVGQYAAAKSHTFPVKKTEVVKCVLRVKGKTGLPSKSKAQRKYVVKGSPNAQGASIKMN
ncbi:MAG: hypothetical protein MI743_07640 [Sneathiellales bacterium]|nr:hypothetical protein [Sneathiellales bacterium]